MATTMTDTAPSTDVNTSASSKASSSKKGPKKGKSRRRPGGRPGKGGYGKGQGARDFGAPRFDVDKLTELAGKPLFEATHPAKLVEVKDDLALVDVTPDGHDALQAKIAASEVAGLDVGATFNVYLSASHTLPTDKKPKKAANTNDAKTDDAKADDTKADEADAPAENPWAKLPWAFKGQLDDATRLADITQKAIQKERVPGIIVGETRGGYAVSLLGTDDVLGVRAFLPKSQATLSRFGGRDKVVGVQDEFDITEFDADRANVVVSRKAKLAKERKEREAALWASAAEGAVVTGVVKSIVPYGAFVDVGGVDGLLHVSDLSWDRQPRVRDVLREGQQLELKVIVADKKAGKLKLGLKQMTPDPWLKVQEALTAGTTVDGVVVAFADFGVFVQLQDGVEGLIHTSEISWKQTKRPEERFAIGETISVKVLGINPDDRRISLSTKALEENPFQAVADRFEVGTVLKAQVSSLADFGAFVKIDDNVEGLVHIGELSWTERVNHPSEMLTIGDEVEVVVLKVDVDKQRVSCSIKQLKENPYQKWEKNYAVGSRHKVAVSRLIERGVLFELEDGLTGQCSTRDLSTEPVSRPAEVCKVGDELEVAVVKFDARAKKVIFSVKAVVEGDVRAAYDEYKKKESEDGGSRMTLGDALRDQLGASASEDDAATEDAATEDAVTED